MNIYANDLYGVTVLKEKQTKQDVVLSEVVGDNAIVEDSKRKKKLLRTLTE